jgi:hypothetical protein
MNTIKLNATLEITPIKFDTDSWKNFSTGYKITCVNYTQEELMHFKQVVDYAQRQGNNYVIVFELNEVLQIVKDFNVNTPTLHTIMSTSNHPVFQENFRSKIL